MGSHSVPWRPAALTAAHPASSRPLGCVLTGKMHASFGSLISYANRGHLAGGKAGRQHLPPKGRQARLLRLPPPNCRAGQGGPFPFHGRRIPTAGSWIRPRRYHCPCRRSFSPLPEFGRGSSTTKPRLKGSSRTRSAPATSDLRIRDDTSGARPRVGPYVQVDFCRVRRHPVGMRKERGLVVAVPISLSRPTQRNYSVLSVRFGRESSSGRGCLFALLKTDHDQMSNQAILGRMFC